MLPRGVLFLIIVYISFACAKDDPMEVSDEIFIDSEISFQDANIGDPNNRTRILIGDEGKVFFPDGYFFQYRLKGSKKHNYLYY